MDIIRARGLNKEAFDGDGGHLPTCTTMACYSVLNNIRVLTYKSV